MLLRHSQAVLRHSCDTAATPKLRNMKLDDWKLVKFWDLVEFDNSSLLRI